ncbi:hypothetical protein QVD17_24336 [Tagetes erecta]|uniref:Uncharacterized protein n=1 Tax=Tagetes erecta TaxID=13708 RepID=A0AAD8NUP3_TARER|nr:hypothetical protein QVD17_24336 [Tagetes erecta]
MYETSKTASVYPGLERSLLHVWRRLDNRRLERALLGEMSWPVTQPVDQAENIVALAQNRTTRRKTGGGRRRGNAAAVGKGRPAGSGGRGRGDIKLIDLDPEPPCDIVPNPVVHVVEPAVNAVADKDIAMEGGSADRIIGRRRKCNSCT